MSVIERIKKGKNALLPFILSQAVCIKNKIPNKENIISKIISIIPSLDCDIQYFHRS